MRCSEARRRLIKSQGTVTAENKELKQHLLTCSGCAAFARAEQSLCRDLATAAFDDNIDDIPLSALKTRVEARAQSIRQAQSKEIPLMSAVIKQIKKRPSLGLTIGVAVVVLAFVTMIPFSFDNTVGYEVAIAGVNKDLAMDSDKINELMAALGMESVNVDVGDCEATCVLKISDLETEGDVDVIVAAFDELGNCELKDISEISASQSMTILQKAHKNMFIKSAHDPSGEEVHEIVIKALCDLDSATDGQFNIWVTDDEDTLICNQLSDGDGHNVIVVKTDLEPEEGGVHDDRIQVTNLEELKCAHSRIFIRDESGERRLFSLDDPDAAEQLEKLGIVIDPLPSSGSGSPQCIWISEDSCAHLLDEYLCDGDSNLVIIKKMGDCIGDGTPGEHQCFITMNHTDDGEEVVVIDDNGMMHNVNLNDPDAVEQLEALGLEVELTRDEDGKVATLKCTRDDATAKIHIKRGEDEDASMKESPAAVPDGFELKQNHPNPFNPTTTIRFSIPETRDVLLEVYNINGQIVRTLIDATVSAGDHSVVWDSTDDDGEQVASGLYFYRLTAGDVTLGKKMTLLK